jgi:hypothetical protein
VQPIPDFPGYFATEDGRIFSTKGKNPRELKTTTTRAGYHKVNLDLDGLTTRQFVHRLVLAAFEGWLPFPEFEGRHLNGNRADNRLANLRWGTRAENAKDRRAPDDKTLEELVAEYRENPENFGYAHVVDRKTRAADQKPPKKFIEVTPDGKTVISNSKPDK